MRSIVVLLSCLLAYTAQASEEAMERFTRISADPVLREQAYEAAQERIRFCVACHGRDGNSTRERIPNLAQQSPIYLFNTFEKFASGERVDYVMSKLAQVLTLEDRVNIAIYFGQQKVKPHAGAVDETLRAHGETIFARTCVACHGSQGQGRDDMPRLAGQPSTYVRKALTRFRDKDPSRLGSVMTAIAENFTDHDIQALATYVETLSTP